MFLYNPAANFILILILEILFFLFRLDIIDLVFTICGKTLENLDTII